ncbi:hypothetical protein pA_gene0071 [Vibrio phage 13VT501A]|nr:hypothetical protein pA_gene0071 [Vibrio phage 13VT501A]
MLKNPANAHLQTHYWLIESMASTRVISKKRLTNLTKVQKALRFIEQCPLKIKHLKIEGFV